MSPVEMAREVTDTTERIGELEAAAFHRFAGLAERTTITEVRVERTAVAVDELSEAVKGILVVLHNNGLLETDP